MTTKTLPPPADLDHAFSYDASTGLLAWRINTTRARAGDEAGTVAKNKTIIVSFKGHKIPAENICWALVYGKWPTLPIRFRNGDRQDLRFDNLVEQYAPREVSDKALAMREYRAKKKAREAALRTAQIADEMRAWADEYPNIAWSHQKQAFVIEEPAVMPFKVPRYVPDRRVIGTAPTFEDAIVAYQDHVTRLDIALAAPRLDEVDPAVLDLTPTARGIYKVSLAEMMEQFTYDAETGWFVSLYPVMLFGFRLDKPFSDRLPKSPRYVPVKGRRYYAHQLAWFMTYHVWPAPRAIVHRDGDPSNNSLRNLYLKEQPDDHET